MTGEFGVFCGVYLIGGTFGNDVDAEERLRDVVKSGEYDAWELEIRPVPWDYEIWRRFLDGLRRSRAFDRKQSREWNMTPLWLPKNEERDAAA